MDFLGIGGWEILVVIMIVLILFGPGKIITVARTLGKITHSLRKITSELTTAVSREIENQEKKDNACHIPEDKNFHE